MLKFPLLLLLGKNLESLTPPAQKKHTPSHPQCCKWAPILAQLLPLCDKYVNLRVWNKDGLYLKSWLALSRIIKRVSPIFLPALGLLKTYLLRKKRKVAKCSCVYCVKLRFYRKCVFLLFHLCCDYQECMRLLIDTLLCPKKIQNTHAILHARITLFLIWASNLNYHYKLKILKVIDAFLTWILSFVLYQNHYFQVPR